MKARRLSRGLVIGVVMKPSFAIVGCGKVGLNLVKFLTKAGYPVSGLASRTIDSAKRAGEIASTDNISTEAHTITKDADVVFITTPDGIIEQTCNDIAGNNGFSEKNVVFHCSGSLPSTLLASAKKLGAKTGSIHPLQSFATTDNQHSPFEGIIAAIEGEPAAVLAGLAIAEDLGARGLKIQTDSKMMYHASAVVASNCLVTLVDFAYKLLGVAGIGNEDAYDVLGPLVEGTLTNIKKVGTTQALTGPVVRGDVSTVEEHIKEIAQKTPDLVALYKILGHHTVNIAKKRGTLSGTVEKDLFKLFE